MSSYVFDNIKPMISSGGIDFSPGTANPYSLALVTSGVFADNTTGNFSNSATWSQISDYDITNDSSYNNTGYTAPVNIASVSAVNSDDSNQYTETILKADDINFNVSTIDARGAVIFRNDVDQTLVCAIDFGSIISSSNGIFTINLSDGFLKIS